MSIHIFKAFYFIIIIFLFLKLLISATLSVCRKTVAIDITLASTGPLKYLTKLITEENDHCAILCCIFLMSGDVCTIFFFCRNTSQKWLQPLLLNAEGSGKPRFQDYRCSAGHASLPTFLRSVLLQTVLILILRGGPFFFTRYAPTFAK